MKLSQQKEINLPFSRKIGGRSTFIIAEIGSNHNQSLTLAYESIDAAIDAGADAVKFQSINIDELYYHPSKETKDLHKKIDLDEKWHWLLSDYCAKRGIIFFSAPTYLKAVDILEEIDVPLYKLASAQIGTFPQIVDKVARTGKPVILSTGIVTSSEIERVIEIFRSNGNDKFIILHCNSIYPTPFEKVYLPTMNNLKAKYDCIVGFSDHTSGIAVSIAAVAMGAKVIEKHFALDRALPVPDAPFSLEPYDFKQMVDGIRAVEKTLFESSRVELQPEEGAFKEAIRLRLVSNALLKKGDLLKAEDFKYLRHREGIDCRDLNQYIECRARYNKDIEKNRLISTGDLVCSNVRS